MKCRYCNLDQAGQMQFIEGYCWNCLSKAQKSSNLSLEVLVGMIKEGMTLS